MLNISENSVSKDFESKQFQSYDQNLLPKANKMFARWLIGFFFFVIILFFLPWTQNIQMKGKVTTLLPSQRPQEVNTTIGGRIEKWFVQEGDLVEKGDTIAFLSEIKADYFDDDLLKRTANQISSKENSINNYTQKADALDRQIAALQKELPFKREQMKNKVQQVELKIQIQKTNVDQISKQNDIALFQYKRTDTLYQKGIKSLSDLEAKRLKIQETEAKLVNAKNKLKELKNELDITQISISTLENEFQNKIAKAESDKFTALAAGNDALGSLNKLQNSYENYYQRNKMYHILAPQAGYITKTKKSGIGEIIKENENITTIVPYERELAVEMYINPMDIPLIDIGQEVSLVFDGWQAFIISGWSDFSFGTYSGEIIAIDNTPNDKSQYRVLIQANQIDLPFPELLKVGIGVKGIALLKDVPVWYELWRQLNGFPADFYLNELQQKENKFKAPVKSVAK